VNARLSWNLTDAPAQNPAPGKKHPVLILILTNLFSVACLAWVIHDAKLSELKDDILTLHWGWLAAAAAGDIAVYVWQGWRWSTLLRPVRPVAFWHCVRAIYVGLFANEILPMRAGEAIRPYLVSRWAKLPFALSLSSVAIERVFDGLWLIGCMLLVSRIVHFPRKMLWIVDGAWVIGLVVLGGAVVLGIALFRRETVHAGMTGWRKQFWTVADNLARIGHSRYLYFALALSLPYLLLQVIPIYGVMRGYGLADPAGAALGWKAAFVTMVLLRLGAVPPQAPGNIGLFQLIAKVTLEELFGVPGAEAARFSLVLWGAVTLPLLAGGFVALVVTGVRLSQLRRDAAADMEKTLG
jgi:hypothetical protein